MKKSLSATVLLVSGIGIALPASALEVRNGKTLNGKTLNGKTLNGKTLNGKTLNGKTLNGVTLGNGAGGSDEARPRAVILSDGSFLSLD